jgi:hypothetical protein
LKLVDALKRKKLLVGEINDLAGKIRMYNTWVETECEQMPRLESKHQPPFEAVKLLAEYQERKEKLVVLKAAIFAANTDVQKLIVELGEVKDEISLLQSLDCNETRNPRVDRNYAMMRQGEEKGEPLVLIEHRKTSITEVARTERITKLQERILEIEAELNNHNFATDITVEGF